ncbi:MAG TPA: hypothetical protein VHV47_11325 [Opitutaceae bacterium]|jgi:hypothetical protein|nr:hypothetical protein [Opitutaceae bacterium]
MKNFQDKYCEAHGCTPAGFNRRLFWRCLHRHALPIVPLILLFKPDYFAADRELIAGVRRAERMNQVWEEIREYFLSPKHTGWLRRKANVRISARRLIETARDFLPATGVPPSAYADATEDSRD